MARLAPRVEELEDELDEAHNVIDRMRKDYELLERRLEEALDERDELQEQIAWLQTNHPDVLTAYEVDQRMNS